MSQAIKLPHLNANEDHAVLTRWTVAGGQHVRKGDVICVVETTKAALDVEAEADGYLHPIAKDGARLSTGSVIGVLLDDPAADPAQFLPKPDAPATPGERRWTKKAGIVAAKLGVDLEALAAKSPNATLGEADVVAASRTDDAADLVDDRNPSGRRERVLLIGGAGGGGAITLDCIFRTAGQRAVGILDNNPAARGKRLMGVEVLGSFPLIEKLWAERAFDAAIVVVTGAVDERMKLFESLVRMGIKAANVVDPSVAIRANVKMGTGNLIMPACFLSTCVTIGDNNFLAAGTMIEHHSVIGSHCTFGPRCALSGAVRVGSRVKFGMGVLVEPYLSLGDDSLVASGVVVTQSVPEKSTLKAHRSYVVRQRE